MRMGKGGEGERRGEMREGGGKRREDAGGGGKKRENE